MFTTSSGAHMDFLAAVWSTHPNVQVLSPALPLFFHRTDTTMRVMTARHFGALRNVLCLRLAMIIIIFNYILII